MDNNFLFCEICDKHVDGYLASQPKLIKHTGDFDFEIKIKPACIDCGHELIQKWIEINVEISV